MLGILSNPKVGVVFSALILVVTTQHDYNQKPSRDINIGDRWTFAADEHIPQFKSRQKIINKTQNKRFVVVSQ